jgi:hypothetical protein
MGHSLIEIPDRLKNEEEIEIILWNWLITNGEKVINIYFNRKNRVNDNIFHTKGLNEKPDFILELNKGYEKEFICVEVKPANKSKEVHESGKILRYYKNYISGSTKYFINNEEIKISGFAVATAFSLRGHLFKEEVLKDNLLGNLDDYKNKLKCIELNLIPRYEFDRTHDYLRRLWAEWREIKKEIKTKEKLPSIGIIINDYNTQKPFLFTMMFVDWLDKKSRWGQRYLKI